MKRTRLFFSFSVPTVASQGLSNATQRCHRESVAQAGRSPNSLCPKCLLRTYVLAPRIRETLPHMSIMFSSPDGSSLHTTSAGVLITGVRKLMHRGHGSAQVTGRRDQLRKRRVGSGCTAEGSLVEGVGEA